MVVLLFVPPSGNIDASDFLSQSPSTFEFWGTFCETANLTIANAIRRFNSTAFVNAQVISHDLYASKRDAIIRNFPPTRS